MKLVARLVFVKKIILFHIKTWLQLNQITFAFYVKISLKCMILIRLYSYIIWKRRYCYQRRIGCKEEYIEETGCLVKERINIYWQHIRQPQYQQSAVEEHLHTCGEGKFHMFPFFKIIQENKITKKILWRLFHRWIQTFAQWKGLSRKSS